MTKEINTKKFQFKEFGSNLLIHNRLVAKQKQVRQGVSSISIRSHEGRDEELKLNLQRRPKLFFIRYLLFFKCRLLWISP
jgi:hypothetical protein